MTGHYVEKSFLFQQTVMYRIYFLLAFLFASLSVKAASVAQAPQGDAPDHPKCQHDRRKPQFDREQMRREQREFIQREAQLSQSEADAFFPLFFELRDKAFDMQRRADRMIENASRKGSNDSDSRRALKTYVELREQIAETEEQYFKRFSRVLSPSKVIRVLRADQKFGREHFRKMFEGKK